jgi:chromosome segregation ATPase
MSCRVYSLDNCTHFTPLSLYLQRAEMLLALEEINQENALLNEQFEATKMESNHKFQEMDEVERECEELEIEIARNNKLQAAKREEATELKRQANDLKDEIATATLALQEAQAEHDTLNAQIVSSPDRKKHELQSQKDALEREKAESKSLEGRLLRTKTRILHVNQAVRDIPEITNLMEEALETGTKIKQIKEQIGEASSERATIDKKTADIMDEMEESEAALHRNEDKLSHVRKQAKVKMDAAQEALEAAKEQLLMVEKDHREGMHRVEAGEAEVRAMEAQIEEERKRTQEEISIMIQEYRVTEKKILEENSKLMKAIGAA